MNRVYRYYALLFCIGSAFAVTYHPQPIGPASVRVSFSIENSDDASAAQNELVFAISSQPSVTVAAQIESGTGITFTGGGVQPLSGGWMGSEYLQWFRLTCVRKNGNPAAEKAGGTILLTYSQPIVRADTRSINRSGGNCIIRIPVLKTFPKRATSSKPSIPYSIGVRMEAASDGIYTLSGSDLKKIGVPIDAIPMKTYRLFCRDKEVPLYIPNAYKKHLATADIILFYGEFLRGENSQYTQYSNTNMYWLTWGGDHAGARVAEASGELKIDPSSYNPDPSISLQAKKFTDTVHCEEDNAILWLGDAQTIEQTENAPLTETESDNWFWGVIGMKKLTSFTFSLPSPQQNTSCHLSIGLTGLSSIPSIQNDHHFTFTINDKAVNAVALWDGQNDCVVTVNNIPSNILLHGENKITFSRQQLDTIVDRAAFNWIRIGYTRGFKSLENVIYFTNEPKYFSRWVQFDLTDFSMQELELWDISKHRYFTSFKTEYIAPAFRLSFQDSSTAYTRYFAQPRGRRIRPASLVLDTVTDAWDFPQGVDYLMLCPQEFTPLLAPLVDFHTQSGLAVETVDMQDIYNRFSYGIRNPESIRLMLKYIFEKHPENPPRYLLLCGDACHDMEKDLSHAGLNIIPTHLTRIPNWGPASNDDYFAAVSGDDNFPDLHVGRFPARNVDELRLLVNKTVNYLRYPDYGYWNDNLILIGGVEADFTKLNNDLAGIIIGPALTTCRVDANPNSPYYMSKTAAANAIAGYLNAGAYAAMYTGHGGGLIWESSFSYSDLQKLHNSQWGKGGRLPVIFSFTCLTGFFESFLYRSLGEEFLRQSADGCIAFYGASAYTKRAVDIKMARTLMTAGVQGSFESLGELISVTEMLMLVQNASEAIPLTRQYSLLGDPALPWTITPDTMHLLLKEPDLQMSDTLAVSGTVSPVSSGSIKMSVLGDNSSVWAEAIKTVAGGSFDHSFMLKPASQTANGLVRAYAWNDSAAVKGWVRFSKDTFSLGDVAISPPDPALGDSISISCVIYSRDPFYVPVVQCRYAVADPYDPGIIFSDSCFVQMKKDTAAGIWRSEKRIAAGSAAMQFDINKHLVLKFFATGYLGASGFYSFALKGRPDLTFTSNLLKGGWRNDSLSISSEVLNKGNAAAPPFTLTFFGYGTPPADTLYQCSSTDSLAPGKTTSFAFSLPDTQGVLKVTGVINLTRAVDEILYTNNSASATIRVTCARLSQTADTLSSPGRGCRLAPLKPLSTAHTVFLFMDSITKEKPLSSESEFIPLLLDSISSFYIRSRPHLSPSDSLAWIFSPLHENLFSTINGDTGLYPSVFACDTQTGTWHKKGGVADTLKKIIVYSTHEYGPHAVGRLADRTPPAIRIFVAGKEILFVDYAARNKPFNIFITDSSGIALPSVRLLLNGEPVENEYQSSLVSSNNGSTVILTAYPRKMSQVDSLTVIAEDNAGNRAVKVFAYRPGQELKIRFFSCHPNPFAAKPGKLVRFPFLLTDIATSVSLTIYTISGRKVWSWKSSTELIGYQEVAWDGTTLNRRNENQGYRIANGTYYAKLVAKNSSRKVEKIIRIAKLEGY